ncbi:serine hydrolase domain-containing protein [Streptomyces xiangluensis]|uniref:Serine hydrolase domain-containing protein n=1 Tax=Streptomyces xiangluensis TaxID=2665720 RepID=A0ABV8Z2J3_9ACTN
MKTELISRVVTTTLATALASIALAVPAEGATAAVSVRGGTHHASDSSALQAHVDTIMKTGTVGVVVRSTGPHGTRNATGGVADQATGDRARPGDRFRIASTTKTFVATVVLQLVAEGRLSLDDTVEHWLPKVVSGNGNDGSKITVRQLLQHTSGLFDYTADFPEFASKAGYQANRYATWTAEQLAAIGMRHAPNFQPGTGWSYSNTNYVLAGMIIKKITGNDWTQEVTARIVRPLGLHDTLAPTTDSRIPGRHLRGYSAFDEAGPEIDVTVLNPSAGGAAGAMISTTADLSHFYQALLGGKLLRPAQLAAMKTTVRASELDPGWAGARYGLGLMEVPLSCGGVYYGHGGDIPGYTTRNGFSADGRRGVVLNASGDGSSDSSSQQTQNDLIDDELCR